jgi:ABC-type branched-subunit amino acid transport system ATPase component/ABC-type branched-subunit amino acid transport system permease subunit
MTAPDTLFAPTVGTAAVDERERDESPARGRFAGGLVRWSDLVGLLFVGALLLAGPSLVDRRLVILIGISYAIVASGLVLLFGAAGQISLGHSIFFAVGAFAAGNISSKTAYGLELELLLAVVIGFAVGVLVGLPSLRVTGLYLAIATFALSFTGQQLLFNWRSVSGGGAGMPAGPLRLFGQTLDARDALIPVGVVLLALVLWLTGNLLSGRTGRVLNALRTSESAVEVAAGVSAGRHKTLAFGFSAAIAAVGGVVYMHTIGFLNPEAFDANLSIMLMVTAVIGGAHRLGGALLGAAFIIGLPEVFRDIQEYEGLLYGSTLLLLVLFSPRGVVGIVEALARRIAGMTSRYATVVDAQRAPSMAAVAEDDTGTPADRIGAALVLEGVHVTFGGIRAVSDVSLTVAPGTVTGILGPNGAGTTTLLNAISGLAPATGSVKIDATDISELSRRKRSLAGLGRTFQNLNVHPDRTALEHVLLGTDRFRTHGTVSELLRLPRSLASERALRSDALALLEQLGLAGVANHKVADLPYGFQKRVDAARALASRPRVLLLDEPTAGLPTHEADELLDQVLRICARRAVTVVIIEHNVEMVARVSDRLVVLDSGSLIADGRPKDVLADPAVIAAYLGA